MDRLRTAARTPASSSNVFVDVANVFYVCAFLSTFLSISASVFVANRLSWSNHPLVLSYNSFVSLNPSQLLFAPSPFCLAHPTDTFTSPPSYFYFIFRFFVFPRRLFHHENGWNSSSSSSRLHKLSHLRLP